VRRVAEDVFQIPLAPRDGINAYLLGDVVVDAGAKVNGGRLIKALHGHAVGAHALTHGHLDHAGGSRQLVEAFDVPVWVGEGDRDAVETGRPPAPQTWGERAVARLGGFEAVNVARALHEGDDLGHGFTVLETPGHSDGHVAYWRERDRTLILGDVLFNLHMLTTLPGLHEPPRILTRDPRLNRESARRLAALEPELALFGHGPPLRDPGELTAFVARFEA
jgi:hydroxyacylglutathione hydrolase